MNRERNDKGKNMRNRERDKVRELVERDERTREREEKYMREREVLNCTRKIIVYI